MGESFVISSAQWWQEVRKERKRVFLSTEFSIEIQRPRRKVRYGGRVCEKSSQRGNSAEVDFATVGKAANFWRHFFALCHFSPFKIS
jgi:hypothetical protein